MFEDLWFRLRLWVQPFSSWQVHYPRISGSGEHLTCWTSSCHNEVWLIAGPRFMVRRRVEGRHPDTNLLIGGEPWCVFVETPAEVTRSLQVYERPI